MEKIKKSVRNKYGLQKRALLDNGAQQATGRFFSTKTYPAFIHFGHGCHERHDDSRRHAQELTMIGQRLGMVAGRGRHDAAQLALFLAHELQNRIPRPPFLEGSGKLSKFGFKVHIGTNELGNVRGQFTRGALDAAPNGHFGSRNVGKGNGQTFILFATIVFGFFFGSSGTSSSFFVVDPVVDVLDFFGGRKPS